MRFFLITLVAILPFLAAANDRLKVDTKLVELKESQITAENVKAVRVRLKKTIELKDCNKRTIVHETTVVNGAKDIAFYQTAFVHADLLTTMSYCPREKPVTKTIYSDPMEFPSLNNASANGVVNLKLLTPAGYELEVTEVN